MKLNFNYYHNLESPEMYLCNPDGKELYVIPGVNRNLKLRFNDLSELSFDVYSRMTGADGNTIPFEGYEYVSGLRLIFVTDIGWFQIKDASETDDGTNKYKSVTAESLQCTFKNKGIYAEERIYCFYNPNDPFDTRYNAGHFGDIPSVLGQWYSQLGIKQDLNQGIDDPDTPYSEWTVTYINPKLIFTDGSGECRTFKEGTTFAYDWIVKEVEDAFGVVVVFDFLYKTIRVMYPGEIATRTGIIYSFGNFMKSAEMTEDTSELVTVLNCTGNNCDISSVNPMGTNYLCDFSYYMDSDNHRWMSPALIAKLRSWETLVDSYKEQYKTLVGQLQQKYYEKAQSEAQLTYASVALTDLKNARDKKLEAGMDPNASGLTGIVTAETVDVGGKSDLAASAYHTSPFSDTAVITCYKNAPGHATGGTWTFSGDSRTGTAESNYQAGFYYFTDTTNGKSYCKLTGVATVNTSSILATYHCGGFERYIDYALVNEWIQVKESTVEDVNGEIGSSDSTIESITNSLAAIANRCNILRFFADTPQLTKELSYYWIEGDYDNENFAILEKTTAAEGLEIASQLMEAGAAELAKVSQPHYSFSIQSVDAIKQYEFRKQMAELELGRVITVEKEDGLWYYPALLEIDINLDTSDDFSLKFANALRLDDWGYTYADLVSSSAAVARKVNANWQNIVDYAKNKETISSLITSPLDATLRAATANMYNQDFVVDSTGVLGRKKKTSSGAAVFEPEQLRMMNNLILFTDDNWDSAKAALGKIKYVNSDGSEEYAYGLIADTIIGSLIMSEHLEVTNAANSITLGESGLQIKDTSGQVMFSATTDGFELYDSSGALLFSADGQGMTVNGYATNDDLENVEHSFSVANGELESRIDDNEGSISELRQSLNEFKVSLENEEDGVLTLIQSRIDDNTADIGLIVKNGSVDAGIIINAINDDTSTVVISADKVNLSGLVTIAGLENGTTTINGSCIETGTIVGSKIKAATITATQIAGGTITAAEIKSGTITSEEIDVDEVSAAVISAKKGYIETLITDKIQTTSLTADHIGTPGGGLFVGTTNGANWIQCSNGSNGLDLNDEMFDVIFGSNEIGVGSGWGLLSGQWKVEGASFSTDDLATCLKDLQDRITALEGV